MLIARSAIAIAEDRRIVAATRSARFDELPLKLLQAFALEILRGAGRESSFAQRDFSEGWGV